MKISTLVLTCFTALNLQAELFFTPQMIGKHVETYSEKERGLIEKDLAVVRSVCLSDTENTDHRFYLATAGAPGARKTTILEKFVASHPEYQKGVYLDPDPRTLRYMVHTYYAQSLNPLVISESKNYDEVIQSAYNRWRGASNYIVLNLFEEAISLGRSVVYGTTSTGGHTPVFLNRLKENGYQTVLLLCSCPDKLRQEAIEHRNKDIRFYQSSSEDAIAKGKFFALRMKDYFDHADLLHFYWSEDLFSPERFAATWSNGILEVHDWEAMCSFIEKYEADRALLATEGQMIPAFESYLRL